MQKTLKARSFRQMTLGQWEKILRRGSRFDRSDVWQAQVPVSPQPGGRSTRTLRPYAARLPRRRTRSRLARRRETDSRLPAQRWHLLGSALLGIWGVTDEPGATRAARKRRTLPKTARYRIAIIVKLADRIANVEENIRTGFVTQFEKYAREFPDLMKYLRNRFDQGAERMWKHLEWLFEKGRELMKAFACGERVVGIPA